MHLDFIMKRLRVVTNILHRAPERMQRVSACKVTICGNSFRFRAWGVESIQRNVSR